MYIDLLKAEKKIIKWLVGPIFYVFTLLGPIFKMSKQMSSSDPTVYKLVAMMSFC